MNNYICDNQSDKYGDNYEGNITPHRKGHAFRNTAIIILVFLLILASAAFTVYFLATQTPNSDKFTAEPDNGIIEKLVTSAIYDENAEITSEDVNSLISWLLNQNSSVYTSTTTLKNAALFFHSDAPNEIYAQAEIGGRIYEVSGEFIIDRNIQNKEIKLNIISAKLGSLPLPPSFVTDYIFNKTSVAQNAVFLRQDGTDIYIDSEYSADVLGQNVSIEITDIEAQEDGLTLKTTSASDIISNYLDSWINSLF